MEFLILLSIRSSGVIETQLAVDDEIFSRKAISVALERAYLKSVSVENSTLAFEMLKKQRFDLVITNVNMPGINGFELCEKLRALPAHTKTPVIFVTLLNGFEARVRSAQSGGDDFIAKPFLLIELEVKALTHALRGQLKAAPPGFQAFSPSR
jgi:CheY-like chemotaxis protein